MELFKILGTIAVDVTDALKKFKDVQNEGGKTESKLGKMFSGIGKGAAVAGKAIATGMVAGGAAVAGLVTKSVQAFAEYEQLVGGSQLLFGDAFGYVQEQAKNAFQTVQMSQNEYLQQVNGFATGLKTALGGNEQAAAELAHKIVVAEADIVAATGNSAENIQNAFNGIMKSNFTMLDNLQLGITPTKEGFQEVIDKVNEWNKANGEATKYQIDNLADCQAALVDYVEMQGLAGYASNEAAGTIQGSVSMMKSSWENLLTAFISADMSLEDEINNFVNSVSTVADNVLPVISTALDGVVQLVEQLAPKIVQALPNLVSTLLPSVISAATELITALANILPGVLGALLDVIPSIIDGVMSIADAIIGALPSVVQSIASALPGLITQMADMLVSLIMMLAEMLPDIIMPLLDSLPDIVISIVEALVNNLPILIEGFVSLFMGIVQALPQIVQNLVDAIPTVVTMLVDAITANLPLLIDGCVQLIVAIGQALPQIIESLVEALPGVMSTIINALVTNLPIVIDGLVQMMLAIVAALPQIVQELVAAIPMIITLLIEATIKLLPTIILGLVQVVLGIVAALPQIFAALIAAIPGALEGIWESLKYVFGGLGEWLGNLFSGAKDWIVNAWSGLTEWFGGVWDGIKSGGSSAWEGIKSAWNSVGEWFSGVWESIKTSAAAGWENIKAFFSTTVPAIVDSVVNFFKELPDKIFYWLGFAIGKIALWGTNAVNWVKTNVPKIIDGIVNFFKELPNKIWTWLTNTITKVTTWGTNLVNKGKDAATNFLNNVVTFFKELPGKVWSWLSDTISKVTTWASNLVSKGKDAASKFINNVVNFFKELPGKIWTWLSNTASKVVSWGSDLAAKGKQAAKQLYDAIVNKVKEIPDKMKQVGKDIVHGIWNGINNAKQWVIDKVKGWAKSLTQGIKDAFGIHSPSVIMRDEVGKMLAEGVAVGIEEASSSAEDAADGMAKNVIEAATERLDEYKRYNELTIADEVAFWAEIRDLTEEGTDDRLQADKKYLEAKKSMDDQLIAAEQKLKEALKETQEELADSFGLFGDVEFDDWMFGSEMIDKLSDQTLALEKYEEELKKLKDKIGDGALYKELAEMGVKALPNIISINSMSDAQLEEFVGQYAKRAEVAGRIAAETAGNEYKATLSSMGIELEGIDGIAVEELAKSVSYSISSVFDTIVATIEAEIAEFDESVSGVVKETKTNGKLADKTAYEIATEEGIGGLINTLSSDAEELSEIFRAARLNEGDENSKIRFQEYYSPDGEYWGRSVYVEKDGKVMINKEEDADGNLLHDFSAVRIHDDEYEEPRIDDASNSDVVDAIETTSAALDSKIELLNPTGYSYNVSLSEKDTSTVNKISEQLDAMGSMIQGFLEQLLANSAKVIQLDTGELVGALASPMDAALGKLSIRKERGMT